MQHYARYTTLLPAFPITKKIIEQRDFALQTACIARHELRTKCNNAR